MRSKGRLALVLFALLFTTCVVTQRNVPLAGTGWVAKRLCSGVFTAGRAPKDVVEARPPIPAPISHEIDREAGSVRAWFAGGFAESVARYRPGLGCTLDDPAGEPTPLDRVAVALPETYSKPLRVLEPDPKLDAAIATAFDEEAASGFGTRAVVVFEQGALAGERYARGFDAETRLTGWSMTKSVTNAMVGILVRQGRIDPAARVGLDVWNTPGDPRGAVTWDQLLRMSDGLSFLELYIWPASDATQMLFGAHRRARGRFAATRELAHAPGTHWNYSSGSTNVLQYAMLETVFGGDLDAYLRFPHETLFGPLGMASAVLEPDASGVYVGSSHMFATARDWARFGQLFLDGGKTPAGPVLSEEWVTYSATPTPTQPKGIYGAQWWLNADPAEGERRYPDVDANVMIASGYEGQFVVVVPDAELVVVRLGFDPGGGFPIDALVRAVVESRR